MKQMILITALVSSLPLLSGHALAADVAAVQGQNQVYGSQLMTPQERNEYRQQMHSAKTVQERERIRSEHHQRMVERAKARGLTLPDMPPVGTGGGMGPGRNMNPGGGMGSGNGMGAGGGR